MAAQTSGTIVGSVRDNTAAIVAGAKVTATSVERGTAQTVASDDDGAYVIPFVAPGTYRVRVEKTGFQPQQSEASKVDVDQRARFDFSLSAGSVQQTIEVTSAAPLVRVESAELGEVITQRSIQTLPLNGRNFAQLVYLVPNVTTGQVGENLQGTSTFNPRAGSAFNALGAQEGTSAWLVDGIFDNEFTFNTVMVQPSVESIQEFKVLTGVYSAEYGRGSGVVTTQTRSGTNAFHGEAFEYYRGALIDARSYFNVKTQPKPNYVRNQFGAAFGGPIWKNHTFFFMDYYGQTQVQGLTFINTVPTLQDRTGDFSDQSFIVYDPYSTTTNSSGQTVRTPLPGNKIPAAYLNQVGLAVASIYPSPNNGAAGATINNYIETLKDSLVDNGGNARIDHRFSDKDSLFGRYSYERYTRFSPKGQGGCCISTPAAVRQKYGLGPFIAGGQNTVLLVHGFALNEVHVITPSLVNQFILGYAHTNPLSTQSDFGINGATSLGINGINISPNTSGIPTINISGAGAGASYTAINDGPSTLPSNPRQTSYQVEDSVSLTKGTHSLKFGYRLVDTKASPATNPTTGTRGSLNFGLNLTNNPVDSTGGSGLASLEMGLLANGNNPGATRGFYQFIPYLTTYEHSAYAQDDWKASSRLTLNLGLRWDLYTPYTERGNNLTNFDLNSLTLQYAGANGVSRSANVRTQYRDFGPRIGFSYTPSAGSALAIRGGYAISYTPEQSSASYLLTDNVPQAISQNSPTIPLYPTAAQLSAAPPLSQPFTAPQPVHPITTADLIAANPTIVGNLYDNKTPSFQSFSLNVEREFFRNYLFEAAYAGSRSVHLLWRGNFQEVQPGPTSIPAASRITIPAVASLRTILINTNRNYANYNGGSLKLTKRFSSGFSLITAYTYSRSLDDGGSAPQGGGAVGDPQTITNLNAGYGPSGYNVPHRFVQSFTWLLPAGPGQRFLNKKNALSYALGGWELDGIVTVQSGLPFTVGNMTSCPNNATTCWPDRVGSARAANQTYAHWYDPSAFAVPCQIAVTATGACTQPAYRYGTTGRGILRGPQTANLDLSAAKSFALFRESSLMFRVDAFDATNHPPLGFPNTTINVNAPSLTSTAITTTTGDNRDLQLSLKLTF